MTLQEVDSTFAAYRALLPQRDVATMQRLGSPRMAAYITFISALVEAVRQLLSERDAYRAAAETKIGAMEAKIALLEGRLATTETTLASMKIKLDKVKL